MTKQSFTIIASAVATLMGISACAGIGSDTKSTLEAADSARTEVAGEQTSGPQEPEKSGSTPILSPAMPIATVGSGAAYAAVPQGETRIAPQSITPGMKVADALMVPGATQTVSAIMTGGKITGTVVVQWKGTSWYTNVDFAEEAAYANGTRYTSPEEVHAFIEIACSDQAVPSDFTDDAVVTDRIR